jgi:hypothetical protein
MVSDKQYDTALRPWMKSHPGFQPGNFLHALAPRGLAAPSSVLVPIRPPRPEGANQDILASVKDGEELPRGFRFLVGKLAGGAADVDLSD